MNVSRLMALQLQPSHTSGAQGTTAWAAVGLKMTARKPSLLAACLFLQPSSVTYALVFAERFFSENFPGLDLGLRFDRLDRSHGRDGIEGDFPKWQLDRAGQLFQHVRRERFIKEANVRIGQALRARLRRPPKIGHQILQRSVRSERDKQR